MRGRRVRPLLPERRRHARLFLEPGEEAGAAPSSGVRGPLARFLRAMLESSRARLGTSRGLDGHGARQLAARRTRLPGIARRLERILAELDELEAWRESADVCSALERLRARTD